MPTFDFLPHAAAVARFGIDSPVLSVAIPLAVVAVRSRKERRQNFFWELLPEGNVPANGLWQLGGAADTRARRRSQETGSAASFQMTPAAPSVSTMI
jgi:hypothetical protein